MATFNDLVGLTLESIEKKADDVLVFKTVCGRTFRMFHLYDCCESVQIEDIVGDLGDLVGTAILRAEESSNRTDPKKDEWDESYTWTFYRIATIKGSVVIRWYGTSNGYYSESADFEEDGK